LLSIASLPAVNATLNATSAVLLAFGYFYIRSGRVDAHRRCMLAALATSALFLTSYLIYHYHVGSVPFAGRGWIRAVYFTILISHTILAVVIVPLVLITLARALKENFVRHRAIARWTLPLWFYVSVTGVVVYWMLYRLGPRP
jgi:putative membrane protein